MVGWHHLCGYYTARFAKIKQLCRACKCPTEMTGYSKSDFHHRKPAHIGGLVNACNIELLRALSQNYINNGFNKVCCGQHNARGIFGTCPGEMLHLITLGWFKYCLESFCTKLVQRRERSQLRWNTMMLFVQTSEVLWSRKVTGTYHAQIFQRGFPPELIWWVMMPYARSNSLYFIFVFSRSRR